jgi:hypothetical protein
MPVAIDVQGELDGRSLRYVGDGLRTKLTGSQLKLTLMMTVLNRE